LNNTYNKKKHEYRQGDGSVTLHLYLFRFRFLVSVSVSVTVTVTVTVKVTQDPLSRTLAKIDGWAQSGIADKRIIAQNEPKDCSA